MGVASNDNIIEGKKWTLRQRETVRQPKYAVHVLGRSRIRQIQTRMLSNFEYDLSVKSSEYSMFSLGAASKAVRT